MSEQQNAGKRPNSRKGDKQVLPIQVDAFHTSLLRIFILLL
jgi:hypothetical protein